MDIDSQPYVWQYSRDTHPRSKLGLRVSTMSYKWTLLKKDKHKLEYYTWIKIPSYVYMFKIKMDASWQKFIETCYDFVTNSAEPYQTMQMRWLIWIYNGRKCANVSFGGFKHTLRRTNVSRMLNCWRIVDFVAMLCFINTYFCLDFVQYQLLKSCWVRGIITFEKYMFISVHVMKTISTPAQWMKHVST